jgi:phosphoenolpyruvate phosphomutase
MKTVYVPMVADCLHPGHLNIIKIAASLGEVTVGLFSDEAVASYKRVPYLNYEQRKAVVESIKGVSHVVKQNEKDYEPNLRKYKPDYMVHGTDWLEGPLKAVRDKAVEIMAEWGGTIVEPKYTEGVSSSDFHKDKSKKLLATDVRIKALGNLLAAKPYIRAVGVYDDLSATTAENAHVKKKVDSPVLSFDAIFFDASDKKETDDTAALLAVNRILEATNKPVLYNADYFDDSQYAEFIIKRLERLGISAIIIDEQTAEKVGECKSYKTNDDFMIFVRGVNSVAYDIEKKYKVVFVNVDSSNIGLSGTHANIFIYANQLRLGAAAGLQQAAAEILGSNIS